MDNNLSSTAPNTSDKQQTENIENNVPCEAIIPESKLMNQQRSDNVDNTESPKVANLDSLDQQPIKEMETIEVVKLEIDSLDQQSPKEMETIEVVKLEIESLDQQSPKKMETIEVVKLEKNSLDQQSPKVMQTVEPVNKLTNVEKIQIDVNSDKIIDTEDSNNVNIHSALTTPKIKKQKSPSEHQTKNSSSLKLSPKQKKSLERLCKMFNLDPQNTLKQNKIYLKQTTAQASNNSFMQLGLQYSNKNLIHGMHITGLPHNFTVHDVRSLIMLKSNFNAMSGYMSIDVFESEKDHLTSECLILFRKGRDFQQVYNDLQGTVLEEREIKVEEDIGQKVAKIRNQNPVNAKRLARFRAWCSKKPQRKQKCLTTEGTPAKTIQEDQLKDNICNDTNQFKNTNLTEEVANGSEKEIPVNATIIQESNEIQEHVNGNSKTENRSTDVDGAKNYEEDQDKDNLRVVLVTNFPKGKNKLKQLKELAIVKTGKDMKYFYCKTKGEQIHMQQDYLFKFLTHEDAVLFRDKLNGAMLACYEIETKLLAVSDVETKQEKRRIHVFNRSLYPENTSDGQQEAKRSKTDDSTDDDNTAKFEAAFMPVPKKSSHTYGLHKKFMRNLGVQAPLETVIEVRDLHPDVNEEKLFEVFSLAGEVKKIDLFGSIAKIEFDHPVEAVQAISLFHNHRLLDKVMDITMAPKRDKISLPLGLKSIGTGLDEDGSPLKAVRTKMELREIHEMLSAIGKMHKIPNGRGIHPFKFKYVNEKIDEQSNTESDIISGNTSIPNKSLIDLLYADLDNENIPNMQCDSTQKKSDINQGSKSNQANLNANLNAPSTRNESDRQSRPYFPSEQDWLNQSPDFNNEPSNPKTTPNTQMANKKGNKYQSLPNQMMGQNNCGRRMSNTDFDQGVQNPTQNQDPNVPTPSTKSQNKNKKYSERSRNRYRVNDQHESSTSNESGKASDMLLFKGLPPSVSGEALGGQMRRVGEVVFCELTAPGRALVRFSNSRDANLCLKLFHRSKVDGRIIDVTLVP